MAGAVCGEDGVNAVLLLSAQEDGPQDSHVGREPGDREDRQALGPTLTFLPTLLCPWVSDLSVQQCQVGSRALALGARLWLCLPWADVVSEHPL